MSMEEHLSKCSDMIIAMTKGLYERLGKLNSKILCFPSAVDFDYFYMKSIETTIPPFDLKDIKRPIIGIMGYLDAKVLDLDLLEYLASKRPHWSLVFIGSIFRNNSLLRKLCSRSNVYFLGYKDHFCIPSYIKFFDVGIIPYRINRYTENVSPLKLYEYLALGKPVVLTNFINFDNQQEVISFASTKEDFINGIGKALAENNHDVIKRRIEIAKENSWDARLKTIENMLNNLL